MAVVYLFFLLQFVPVLLGYAQESISLPEMEWDGHLKIYSRILFPKSDSVYQYVGLSPNYDGYGELHLNNKTFFSDTLFMVGNYEA